MFDSNDKFTIINKNLPPKIKDKLRSSLAISMYTRSLKI